MHKLLLADGTGNFIKPIMQQLKSEYEIRCCANDGQTLLQIEKFQPDILLLDLQLPTTGGLAILRALRSTNVQTRVIVITPLVTPCIQSELSSMDVSGIYLSTCRIGALVGAIRQISNQIQIGTYDLPADPAVEVDNILLDLGFAMGRSRYTVIREAVLYVYRNPDCYMTKCLYPDLASQFRTTITQVEKAIRDAIKSAWNQGSIGLWKRYLRRSGDASEKCPSNEVFLAYAAHALRCRMNQTENVQRIAK